MVFILNISNIRTFEQFELFGYCSVTNFGEEISIYLDQGCPTFLYVEGRIVENKWRLRAADK
ncbi:hypothetical protein BLA29_005747 [Euroglyphus maynei]|uniref:Uncharacterized protein n=1 Tax=Euroglyphus maynei TaxID=6958 RepID=A0A1Y3BR95_EURMA|nr:hypothetical protein BLA29_005747 [Euroglyphus maynei]